MFCEKCGMNLPEGVTSCPNCDGVAPVVNEAPAFNEAPNFSYDVPAPAPAAPDKKKLFIIGGAALAAIIIIVVLLVVLLSGGATKTLEKYLEFNYNYKGSASSYISNRYPDEILEEMLEDMDMTEDEYIVELEERQIERQEELEEDGITYEFEILNEKDMKGSDLREINDDLEDYGLEASKGVIIKVKIIKYVYGDKEDSYTRDYEMIKIGGSWYVD